MGSPSNISWPQATEPSRTQCGPSFLAVSGGHQPPRMARRSVTAAPAREDDPKRSARTAGLRYVTDAVPGIMRRRSGRGFVYTWPDGRRVDDPEVVARIRSLAVPPAWTDVWISPIANGHLQAFERAFPLGKDFQYEFLRCAKRNGVVLHVQVSRTQAVIKATDGKAYVVGLLEATLIRVGNDEYAHENRSFGLTTLHDRHAEVNGTEIRFRFRGKGGREHDVDLRDRRLAAIVKRCQDVPGYELFQYVDEEGRRRTIDSQDVNDYLREVSGGEFTAKDFRTWAGTVSAALGLEVLEPFGTEAEARRNVAAAIERVAERLGNTPAICRKCYVHPDVIEAYLEGETLAALRRRARGMAPRRNDLSDEEAAVMALLRRRLDDRARSAAAGR